VLLLLAPWLVGFSVFFGYPIVMAVYLSLNHYDLLSPPRWIGLTKEVTAALARSEVSGAIISHGTDTLEETAWWLDLTVNSEKPIVLIGAQRNASEKDFDGPRNLLNAVRICVDPASKGKGAMIALNDQINAARDVTKTHTSNVETFKSGDFGFLGVVDFDRVIFARAPLRRQHIALKSDSAPYVEIVAMYGGADGRREPRHLADRKQRSFRPLRVRIKQNLQPRSGFFRIHRTVCAAVHRNARAHPADGPGEASPSKP